MGKSTQRPWTQSRKRSKKITSTTVTPTKDTDEFPQETTGCNPTHNIEDVSSMKPSLGIEDVKHHINPDMMKDFELMTGNNDDAIISHVEQLVSKKAMYTRLRRIVTHIFPQWLEEKKAELSQEDHTRHERQYQCYQRLVSLYESDPGNTRQILQMMDDIQQYGPLPAEIVKELAPDLDIDPERFPNKFDFSVLDIRDGDPKKYR
jgi:hypothetical protein